MAGDVNGADGNEYGVMEEGRKRKAREKYRHFVDSLSDKRKEERNLKRREASKLMKTRKVNIGHQKPRWDAMKSQLGVRSDRDLAQILLSTYLKTAFVDQSATSEPLHHLRANASNIRRSRRGRPCKQGRGTSSDQSHSRLASHSSVRKARQQAFLCQDGSVPVEVMQLNPALDSEMKEDFSVSVMQLLPDHEPCTGSVCKQEMPSVQDSPSGQSEWAEDLLVSDMKLGTHNTSRVAEAGQDSSAEKKEVGGSPRTISNRSASIKLDFQKSSVRSFPSQSDRSASIKLDFQKSSVRSFPSQSDRLPSNMPASSDTTEDRREMVTVKVEPE